MSLIQSLVAKPLRYLESTSYIEKNIDEIQEGASQDENYLFYRSGENIKIYDRTCDHNGGKLSLRGKSASCPLHGWELDLKLGFYINARCHKKPVLEVNEYELDSPVISIPKTSKELCVAEFDEEKKTEVRFINHACLLFKLGGVSFATDPWLVGSAFCNGWWLAKSSPKDAFDEINNCDFIYISHNHPDHLHKESLEHIRKDMPIVTADFLSGSTKSLLYDYGFSEIVAMDFVTALMDVDKQLFFAVLKSGDFRDDSGLFFQNGRFKCLLTVDSNFLDFGRFPQVDLLCSSFAGGASGFPLCFENYTEKDKRVVVSRNCGAIKAANTLNIKGTKATTFMPYAGFFTEKAKRDSYIKERNIKNCVEDFEKTCAAYDSKLLNVDDKQRFLFKGSELVSEEVDECEKMLASEVDECIAKMHFNKNLELSDKVLKYFEGCEFKDNLIVDLIATNDDFSDYYDRFCLDFTSNTYSKVDVNLDVDSIENDALSSQSRYLQIKVRRSELFDVITEGKPWEELSIGFQCRIYRQPNIYNSEFWFYFTNRYIGSAAAIV